MKQQMLNDFNAYLQSVGEQADYETLVDMEVMLVHLLAHKKRLHNQTHGFPTSYSINEYLERSRHRRALEHPL